MDPGDENDAEPDTVEIVTADESAANGFGSWLYERNRWEEVVGVTFREVPAEG